MIRKMGPYDFHALANYNKRYFKGIGRYLQTLVVRACDIDLITVYW